MAIATRKSPRSSPEGRLPCICLDTRFVYLMIRRGQPASAVRTKPTSDYLRRCIIPQHVKKKIGLIVKDGSLSASNLQISASHSPLPHRTAVPRNFHPQIPCLPRRYPHTHAFTRGMDSAHRGIVVAYRIRWHDFVHVVKDQCDAPRAASRLTARPGISCIERITTLISAMQTNEDELPYQIVFPVRLHLRANLRVDRYHGARWAEISTSCHIVRHDAIEMRDTSKSRPGLLVWHVFQNVSRRKRLKRPRTQD